MSDVVKVDKRLLKEIEELIKQNRFLYTSKKQVVNLALVEFLNTRIKNSRHYKKSGDFLSKKSLLKKKKEGK